MTAVSSKSLSVGGKWPLMNFLSCCGPRVDEERVYTFLDDLQASISYSTISIHLPRITLCSAQATVIS